MSKKKWIAGGMAALVLGMAVWMFRGAFPVVTSDGAEAKSSVMFSDVAESDWFYEDVTYVKDKKLMNGTGGAMFSPDSVTTRGMLVTVLWRMEEAPMAETALLFTDVASDAYYHDAVAWAMENKIVSGYSDTSFGPEDSITREQLATIFYRYATYKNYDVSSKTELDTYVDETQVSDYAKEALQWANAEGIITGITANTLEPKGEANRAQTAAILRRFSERFTASEEAQKEEPTEEPLKTPEPVGGGSASGRPRKEAEDDTGKDTTAEEKTEGQLPLIRTGNAKAKPGEIVRIPVEVKNNPGILGMILKIEYDDSVLMLESVENGEALAKILTMTPSKTLESGARFVWDGLELMPEDIKDGTVLLMNFKIADTADEGKYSINVGYAEGDIIDNSLDSISFQMEQGYIEIEGEKAKK